MFAAIGNITLSLGGCICSGEFYATQTIKTNTSRRKYERTIVIEIKQMPYQEKYEGVLRLNALVGDSAPRVTFNFFWENTAAKLLSVFG